MSSSIKMLIFYFFNLFFFSAVMCEPITKNSYSKINEIPTPEGFKRIQYSTNSFGDYLHNLELKTNNNQVFLFNGELKQNQNAQFAVLKIDVGDKDLQQCADAVMRLRAEYLLKRGDYGKIHFNFTNGEPVFFEKYAKGYRPIIKKNNKIRWELNSLPDTSYKSFRKFMDLIFSYAGTSSLIKELEPIKNIKSVSIGDVFIQTGNPFGHAIIVADVAVNEEGEKVFLLIQSYMPAQEMHILKNLFEPSISPWYSETKSISTPEWDFTEEDLYRFK